MRVDLGGDIPVSEPDGADLEPVFHLNARRAGVAVGPATILAELVNVARPPLWQKRKRW